VGRGREVRIGVDDGEGVAPGRPQDVVILDEVGDLQLRQPVLARAEELPRPAQAEVGLGDLEPVVGLGEAGEAGPARSARRA